jgi:hypothetical protein
MSQGQQTRPSHLPLEGLGTSPGAGSEANILLHKLIEQGLRDMAKSAQTIRDVMISAQPTEEGSREQALIEHEERIAAIQALAQGVSELQSLMRRRSGIPTSDTHSLSRDEVKQKRREQGGIDVASGMIESKEEEEDTLPGDKGEDSKPRQPSHPTPEPNTSTAAVPLHLIPLVPPRSGPSNRRRTSIDPFFVATKNDEDAIDLPWRINLFNNATGDTTSDSQSDLWHFQNCEAGSPGISRTLAYAMGCTRPVEPSYLPILGGVGVDREDSEEKLTKREGNDAEQAHRPQVLTAARSDLMKEGPQLEDKSPRTVASSDVEAGKVRGVVEEMKAVAKDILKDQVQEGTEFDHTEVRGDCLQEMKRTILL